MNIFRTSITWNNSDVYIPDQNEEPIIYCTSNNKIGVLNGVKHQWSWLKEKYHIKWWCYQYYILPNEKD